MMRAYRKIKCHLRSQAGMTLTEMLAAVLILSMTATAIGGGVAVVKEAHHGRQGQLHFRCRHQGIL